MTKTVIIKFTENELEELDEKVKISHMNRSDYIRGCIKADPIQIIDKSAVFYKDLCDISSAVNKTEEMLLKGKRVSFDS